MRAARPRRVQPRGALQLLPYQLSASRRLAAFGKRHLLATHPPSTIQCDSQCSPNNAPQAALPSLSPSASTPALLLSFLPNIPCGFPPLLCRPPSSLLRRPDLCPHSCLPPYHPSSPSSAPITPWPGPFACHSRPSLRIAAYSLDLAAACCLPPTSTATSPALEPPHPCLTAPRSSYPRRRHHTYKVHTPVPPTLLSPHHCSFMCNVLTPNLYPHLRR